MDAGRYEISNEKTGKLIAAKDWQASIEPGMMLSMAMVLRKKATTDTTEHDCPSCNSPYQGLKSNGLERVRWYVRPMC